MSWMDDGGFEIKTFAKNGKTMARMSFRTSTGQYYFNFTKTDVNAIESSRNWRQANDQP